MGNILSFDIPFIEIDIKEEEPTGIWETLHSLIEKEVKKNGIRKDSIQPYETQEDVIERAVDTIYFDVAEFYGWYFSDDDRTIWIGDKATQNKSLDGKTIPFKNETPEKLREAVGAVVKDNLDSMRDADEIPAGLDTPALEQTVTDSLTKYIFNWESWFYDRKELEDIDNYFEQLDFHDEIYLDEDYGLLSNLVDDSQFDGVSDVPYIAEK